MAPTIHFLVLFVVATLYVTSFCNIRIVSLYTALTCMIPLDIFHSSRQQKWEIWITLVYSWWGMTLILICTVDSSFLLTEAKVDKRFLKGIINSQRVWCSDSFPCCKMQMCMQWLKHHMCSIIVIAQTLLMLVYQVG